MSMTLDEFRIAHSNIIALYQGLEFNLKRICSILSDKGFIASMDDHERDSMGSVIRELIKLTKDNDTLRLSDESYDLLNRFRERRNYWCHQCYLDICVKKDAQRREVLKVGRSEAIGRMLIDETRELEAFGAELEELYFTLTRNRKYDSRRNA